MSSTQRQALGIVLGSPNQVSSMSVPPAEGQNVCKWNDPQKPRPCGHRLQLLTRGGASSGCEGRTQKNGTLLRGICVI